MRIQMCGVSVVMQDRFTRLPRIGSMQFATPIHLSLSLPPPASPVTVRAVPLSLICVQRKMAAWSAAARRAPSLADVLRFSSSQSRTSGSEAVKLLQRRGLAGGGDHHGPPKVNFWQDPLSPSKWKEEHFVIVSLSGWALLIYGGFKMFSGGKKEKKEEKVAEGIH